MANFDFTCPQCGVSVEADESYRGMVLECPSCGKGIVVPRVGGVPRSKLKHVTQQEKQEDLNAVAIRRRLAEQEAEEAAEQAKEQAFAAKIRKQRMVSTAVKSIIVLVLVGVVAFGVMVWRRHAAEQERVREEERQRTETENALERKKREAEWQKKRDEVLQRQQEEAEKRAEAEKKRKEERERERAEQKRLRDEREKERQDKIAAAESLKKERKERAEKFDRIGKLFSKATVDLWKNMPQDARPGTAEGVFYCLIPFDEKDHGVYEVGSSTNGPMRVVKLSKKVADEPLEVADYAGLVAKYGCLCLPADGKIVYVSVPKSPDDGKYVVPSSSVEPSSLLWGEGLCALIKRYSIGTQNLVYDVSYLTARGKALPLGPFAFGKPLGRSELQSAVLAVAMKNWRPPKVKAKGKTFRPTVVFYDGKTIKRGADGVTYVPRSPDGRVGASYGKLSAEAIRQEEMLAATQESQDEEAARAKDNFREGVISAIPDGSLQITVKVKSVEE